MGYIIESFDIGRVNGNVYVWDYSLDVWNLIDYFV